MADERERVESVSRWYLDQQEDLDRRFIRYRYEAIRPYIRGGKGLELGPAEGEMTRLLVSHFDHLVVVEGAAELLNRIPALPGLFKVHALFEDFEPGEPVDTIVMDHVLEHVEDPAALVRRAAGWLRAGGRLIAGVPNANSVHRLVAVKMGLLPAPDALNERDQTLGHRRVLDPASLRTLIEGAGLAVVGSGGVFFKPLSLAQIQQQWTDAMIEGFHELGKDFPELCAEIFCVGEQSASAT